MFTALASSLQVRLSSSTNTQGLPTHRLIYIAFAKLKLHVHLHKLLLWEFDMKPQLSHFTAVIGIDWADTKHDMRLGRITTFFSP